MEKLISRLNLHLPLQRITIKQLLQDPDLEIVSKSGARFKPRRLEIQKLAQKLTPQDLERYLIPILLEIHSDGCALARGLDAELVSKLLEMDFDGSQLWINQIQLQKLRSEYPSLIQYILTMREIGNGT